MERTIRPGFHIIPTEQGPSQVTAMALLLTLHAKGDPATRSVRPLVFEYRKGTNPLDIITVTHSFALTSATS